jgi:5-formyltetrahydrofolate cyclo-ligase
MSYQYYALKPWWRIRAKALVSSVSGRELGHTQVQAHWLAWLHQQPPTVVVALYAPLPKLEVPLLEVTLACLPPTQVLLPRMLPRGQGYQGLAWHTYAVTSTWHQPFGKGHPYRQPMANTPPWQGNLPDVCLIPCPLLDDYGIRLGYGGGWYDRQLAYWQATHGRLPLCIGVGLSVQRVRRLPAEPHDQPLHAWLDETGYQTFLLQPNKDVDCGAITRQGV